MRGTSLFLREFNRLLCDIARTSDLSDKFSEQDRDKALKIAEAIADLARREIQFIEDINVRDLPDSLKLRSCIDALINLMQDERDKYYFSQYSAMVDSYLNDEITRVRRSARSRTQEERLELMKKAGILDEEGYYSPKFFSKETVERDRAHSKAKGS